MFSMIVEATHEIAGRGVVVSGEATSDSWPTPGSYVLIVADGKEPIRALVRGVDMGNVPPRFGLHLGGVSKYDIPIGARIETV